HHAVPPRSGNARFGAGSRASHSSGTARSVAGTKRRANRAGRDRAADRSRAMSRLPRTILASLAALMIVAVPLIAPAAQDKAPLYYQEPDGKPDYSPVPKKTA